MLQGFYHFFLNLNALFHSLIKKRQVLLLVFIHKVKTVILYKYLITVFAAPLS